MPGVYSTVEADSEQPRDQPLKKPKEAGSKEMDVKTREEEGGGNTSAVVRQSSPLIDLTSRSPSPLPPPTQRPVAVQLSTYVQSAQTRVNTTGSLRPPAVTDNPSEQPSTRPAVHPKTITISTFSSSSPLSSVSRATTTGLQQSINNPLPTTATAGGASNVGVVSMTTVISSTAAAGSSVAVTSARPYPLPLARSLPREQPQLATQVSSQTTGDGGRGQSDGAPPALLEYVESPMNGSNASRETQSCTKGEPPQFGSDLTPREPPSSQTTNTVAMVTGTVQDTLQASSSELQTNIARRQQLVGVASVQVGVVSPSGSTGKVSVGMGGGEGGDKGEDDEGEDGESVMELRIEDSVIETEGEEQHTLTQAQDERDVPQEDIEMVPDPESHSHSNSVGTSPTPPRSLHSGAEVRVHEHPVVVDTRDPPRVAMEIRQRGQGKSDEGDPVNYHRQTDRPSVVTHSNSLVTKSSVATVSPSLLRDNNRGSSDGGRGFGVVGGRDRVGMVLLAGQNGNAPSNYRARKVAKVKQFFTTLQRFGENRSREVAEQVQELIAALVNGTATIEEFHQEIQTVTNHPLRQFIIPFLRENLDMFREDLRDSEHGLSDILTLPPSSSSSSSITMTPMIDDDLPVLPSSKPTLTPSHNSHSTPSHPMTADPASHVASLHYTSPSTTTNIHSVHSQTHPIHPVTMTMNFDSPLESDSAQNSPLPRKRPRPPDKPTSSDIHSATITSITEKLGLKRPRPEQNHTQPSVSVDTVAMATTTHRVHSRTPPYPPILTSHQQHSLSPHEVTLSHPPRTPTQLAGHAPSQVVYPAPSRKQLLAEDWAHVDMMLSSVVGMVEKARNAISILRERALHSTSDLEKREEQQRVVAEATEKARRLWLEEKNHIVREHSRKMKEAVAQVKVEMEQKMVHAQSLAVQEALNEANTQTNSKESCWNCGRRATETCSGCNKARYCGTYCQHKDWNGHMHKCASGLAVISDDHSSSSSVTTRAILQSGDTRMTSSVVTEEPPDVKPRISPEQLNAVSQNPFRYPMT